MLELDVSRGGASDAVTTRTRHTAGALAAGRPWGALGSTAPGPAAPPSPVWRAGAGFPGKAQAPSLLLGGRRVWGTVGGGGGPQDASGGVGPATSREAGGAERTRTPNSLRKLEELLQEWTCLDLLHEDLWGTWSAENRWVGGARRGVGWKPFVGVAGDPRGLSGARGGN